MSWKPLSAFRDPAVPKLYNLALAERAGLTVPTTFWCDGAELARTIPPRPPGVGSGPVIVRSGSPTEDTEDTSNAGQLLSLPVRGGDDFEDIVRQVVEALPDSPDGLLGVAFVQPLIEADRAGVAFYDGYYFERAVAEGSNEAITAGAERGTTDRGHAAPLDPWTTWLHRVYDTIAGARGAHDAIDVEFCETDGAYTLLQVRPALFEVRRNPTISLANHKEILGDLPSPWIVSAMAEGGRDANRLYTEGNATLTGWNEPYAIEAAGRCWMNFTFFYRLLDRLGVPRQIFLRTMGGGDDGDASAHASSFGRMLRGMPYLTRVFFRSLGVVRSLPRRLAAFDAEIDACPDEVGALHALTGRGMGIALSNTFAINNVLSFLALIRRGLGVRAAARVVTQDMMDAYERLRGTPVADRPAALDGWLAEFGHRGPFETDPMQPRFSELREVLLADLMADGPVAPVTAAPARAGWARPLFWMDEKREWYRDQMMRRWARLRPKILRVAAALVDDGQLDAVDDVFFLRHADFASDRPLRASVAANRARHAEHAALRLAPTSSLDAVSGAQASADLAGSTGDRFAGIALSPDVVEGRILRGTQLTAVLGALADADPTVSHILLVPSLEPSWAVVFGRFAGVISELGGEMSHASILLREARKPAIVNCADSFGAFRDGDRVRLDGARGIVERLPDPSQ